MLIVVIVTGCNNSNEAIVVLEKLSEQEIEDLQFLKEEEKLARDVYLFSYDLYNTNGEVYNTLNTKCYICHSINSVSHDVIIVPPMAAVKWRYSRSYRTKKSFVEAITKWTMDPKAENALMPGAVDNFNVMPKQIFVDEEIRKIAAYIYENELEEPDWYAAHQEEMHGNNMAQGRNRMKRGNF